MRARRRFVTRPTPHQLAFPPAAARRPRPRSASRGGTPARTGRCRPDRRSSPARRRRAATSPSRWATAGGTVGPNQPLVDHLLAVTAPSPMSPNSLGGRREQLVGGAAPGVQPPEPALARLQRAQRQQVGAGRDDPVADLDLAVVGGDEQRRAGRAAPRARRRRAGRRRAARPRSTRRSRARGRSCRCCRSRRRRTARRPRSSRRTSTGIDEAARQPTGTEPRRWASLNADPLSSAGLTTGTGVPEEGGEALDVGGRMRRGAGRRRRPPSAAR